MRTADLSDKNKVVHIITESFTANPGINSMFATGGNREKKIKRMAEFAFVKSFNRNGVFLSSNEKGVALFYKSSKKVISLREWYLKIKFGLSSIQFLKIREVLKRESIRKGKRPNDQCYYYFWFLAVLKKDGANAGFELHKELLNKAQQEKIPIYLETTLLRNKMVYERLGYKTFDTWTDKSTGVHFWFLKYNIQ